MKAKAKLLIPTPPLAAAIAAIIIMTVLLMIIPVGMADNGDFFRVTNGNGIYKLDRGQNDEYFDYFSTQYGEYQYYNEYEESIVSSQTIFIKAAMWLDNIFTADNRFDIRFMSGIFILYCAVAIYLLVDYAAYKANKAAGYIIAAFSVFIFADSGYTLYFNSFYAEGLEMVSFLSAMGSLLLVSQKRYSPYVLYGIFFVNAVILTFSKQQNAPTGILMALLIFVLIFTLLKENRENKKASAPAATVSYIRNTKVFVRLMSVFAAALIGCGIAVYVLIPQEFVNINAFHAMTRGVLIMSENPEDALQYFDISKQYALLNGETYYDRYPSADPDGEPMESSFFANYSTMSIVGYYIEHPSDFMRMMDIAGKSAYKIRPVLGNYEKSAGYEPEAETQIFALYSSLKEAYMPKTIGFILIWAAVVIALSLRKKSRTVILVFAMTAGLAQIVVSIVGAGDADIAKHVFLFNVAFDLILFVGFAALVNIIANRIKISIVNRAEKNKAKNMQPEKTGAEVRA